MESENRAYPAIERLAQGSLRDAHDGAWRLFETAWPVLERFVRVRLESRGLTGAMVQDCGQNVFTRIWAFRHGYRGESEGQFWSWVASICDNERCRVLGRSIAQNQRWGEFLSQRPDISPPKGAENAPLAESIQNEAVPALAECLKSLDQRSRQVIELLYFRPILPERAAAELLALSPATVHKIKVQALERLRGCLNKKGIAE